MQSSYKSYDKQSIRKKNCDTSKTNLINMQK